MDGNQHSANNVSVEKFPRGSLEQPDRDAEKIHKHRIRSAAEQLGELADRDLPFLKHLEGDPGALQHIVEQLLEFPGVRACQIDVQVEIFLGGPSATEESAGFDLDSVFAPPEVCDLPEDIDDFILLLQEQLLEGIPRIVFHHNRSLAIIQHTVLPIEQILLSTSPSAKSDSVTVPTVTTPTNNIPGVSVRVKADILLFCGHK